MKFPYPKSFSKADKALIPETLYATILEDDDASSEREVHETREAAAALATDDDVTIGVYVATYRLEKIEILRLKTTTEVIVVLP